MTQKFKYFDLIENPWASERNPIKYGVYLGTRGSYFEVLSYDKINSKPTITRYDRNCLEKFKFIKHTNIKDILKQID
jgi:hypothetical protein